MSRDAKADLALREAVLSPTFTAAPSDGFFEWREKREEVLEFAAYWITLAEAYRELSEAQNYLIADRKNNCSYDSQAIDRMEQAIRIAQAKIAELEAK